MTTPAQAEREREKARLSRIAMIADRCAGDRWEIDVDGKQTHVVATRSTGDRAILCTIFEDALPDEVDLISGALSDAVLFLSLRRRAIAALKSSHPASSDTQQRQHLREGDFAANAAMLCADPLFHRFLERRQHPAQARAIHNKEHADTVLKTLIGITSKTQLNREERAQAAFIDLRTDFDIWAKRVSV